MEGDKSTNVILPENLEFSKCLRSGTAAGLPEVVVKVVRYLDNANIVITARFPVKSLLVVLWIRPL
jgi:hypothetical protein